MFLVQSDSWGFNLTKLLTKKAFLEYTLANLAAQSIVLSRPSGFSQMASSDFS